MLRGLLVTLAPIFAVVLPALLGMGLLYLYFADVLSVASVMLGAFVLVSTVVTGVLVARIDEEHPSVPRRL